MHNPAKVLRGAAMMLAIGIVAWLAVDAKDRRRSQVDRAILAGEIGCATRVGDDTFAKFCDAIIHSGGIETPVNVDALTKRGLINIISTVDSARRLTGCNRGNAIYDASLDCIFVDNELITEGLRSLPGSWNSRTLYLAFILLHELGHRQLHRRSGAMFDAAEGGDDSAAMERELQADEFSVNALRSFYERDLKAGGSWVGIEHRSAEPFLATAMADSDRMWADFMEMARELPDELLRTRSEYSPLYRDLAHPMLVSRLSRTLQGVKATSIAYYPSRVLFSLVREELSRICENGRANVCEIVCPEEIGGVFKEGGTLVLGTRQGTIYHLGMDRVKRAVSKSGYGVLKVSAEDMTLPASDAREVFAIWRTPKAEVILADAQGSLRERRVDKWEKRDLGSPVAPRISKYRKRMFRDETCAENSAVCLLTGDTFEGFTYYGISDEAIVSRTAKDLELEIAQQAKLDAVTIKPANVIGDQLYCGIFDPGHPEALFPTLAGIACIALPTLKVQKVELLNTLSLKTSIEAVVVSSQAHTGPRFFGIGLSVSLAGPNDLGWSMWELFAKAPVKLVGGSTYLTSFIRDPLDRSDKDSNLGPLRRGYEPEFYQAVKLGSDKILVNFLSDSIYLVDLSRQMTRVFAQPGGADVLAMDADTVALLPNIGSALSHRCYILFINSPPGSGSRRYSP